MRRHRLSSAQLRRSFTKAWELEPAKLQSVCLELWDPQQEEAAWTAVDDSYINQYMSSFTVFFTHHTSLNSFAQAGLSLSQDFVPASSVFGVLK